MSIAENLRRVRERIARAAESAGRRADEITLVGVTKYVGPREAAELVAAGCADLGESRPQELWTKADALAASRGVPAPGHPLAPRRPPATQQNPPHAAARLADPQRRQRAAAGRDRTRLDADADDKGPPVNVLLEVNTSGEAAKHGLAPNDVEPLLAAAAKYPHVAIRG